MYWYQKYEERKISPMVKDHKGRRRCDNIDVKIYLKWKIATMYISKRNVKQRRGKEECTKCGRGGGRREIAFLFFQLVLIYQ